MLNFFKKKIKSDAKVAVCSDENTIAIARIRREKDLPPSLDVCEVQEVENISIRDSEIARLTKVHDLDQYTCLSSLDIGDYNLLLVEAPDVEPDEVRAAIRWKVKELIDFRQGVRAHALMNSIAQTLSDKDITDIAAWYNAISIKP